MESFPNRLKSLKDTLLEYAVLNLDLLFPSRISAQKEEYDIESVPSFPPFLFEEMLEKSKDMCWPIATKQLMPCISARDKLKWNENSCFRFIDKVSEEDLKFFDGSSMGKLKILKLVIHTEEPTVVHRLKKILKSAGRLEELELIFKSYLNISNGISTGELEAIGESPAPLKLSRIRSKRFSFEILPCTLDSDKLRVLDLDRTHVTKSFLKTLVGFKRIVHLSLYRSTVVGVSSEEVIEAVTSLKSLSILNLCLNDLNVDEVILNKIMKDMENLDLLEVNDVEFNDIDRLLTPRKKLKVLNLRFEECEESFNIKMSALDVLADKIGNCQTLNGLITILSTTPTRELYSNAIFFLMYFVHTTFIDIKELQEAEKNGIFNFRSPLRMTESHYSGRRSRTTYDLPLRMACYKTKDQNYQSASVIDWIKDFAQRNKNTHLAERFTRFLDTSDYL